MAKVQQQEPQVSLISSSALPVVTPRIDVPDIAGPARRLARDLQATAEDPEAKAQKAYEDYKQGRTEGGNWKVGIDKDGNYTKVPKAVGSLAYQRGADEGLGLAYGAQTETDMSDGLNRIQNDPTIPDGEKPARMKSYIDGFLPQVPDQFRPNAMAYGADQLKKRAEAAASDAAKTVRVNTINAQKAIISKSVSDASGLVAAGGDPKPFFERIVKANDTLVKMGQISKEDAELSNSIARQTIWAIGNQRRIINDMEKNGLDPAEVEKLASFIQAGGDYTITTNIPYSNIEEGGRPEFGAVTREYVSSDFHVLMPDEDVRKRMATELRIAANAQQSFLSGKSSHEDMMRVLQKVSEVDTTQLPDGYNKPFNDLATTLVVDRRVLDDDDGRQLMLDTMSGAKKVPPVVVDELRARLLSSNPKLMEETLEYWRRMRMAKSVNNVDVGTLMAESVSEPVRNLLDAALLAKDNSLPMDHIIDALRKMSTPDKTPKIEAVRAYNAAVGAAEADVAGYNSAFKVRWREDHEGLSIASGDVPHGAQDRFDNAYYMNYLLTNDAEASFEAAYKAVNGLYSYGDIFVGGVSLSKAEALKNPTGYEERYRVKKNETFRGLSIDRSPDEYEWLQGWMKSALKDKLGNLSVEEREYVLDRDDPLGTTLFLEALPSNTDLAQYEVTYRLEDGTIGKVMVENADGFERRLVVDPGAERAQLDARSVSAEQETAILDMAEREKFRVRAELWPRSTIGVTDFDAFLKSRPKEEREKYLKETAVIDETARRAIQKQREANPSVVVERPKKPTDPAKPLRREKGVVAEELPMTARAAGGQVVDDVVGITEQLFPDGTGGRFMKRIAAQESLDGKAPGTFRTTGDKGIWQVSTSGAFFEVQRRIAEKNSRTWLANETIKARLGIDLSKMKEADLDKPMVSGLFARLYLMTIPEKIPASLNDQAIYWKEHYNTSAGKGTPGEFIRNAQADEATAGIDIDVEPELMEAPEGAPEVKIEDERIITIEETPPVVETEGDVTIDPTAGPPPSGRPGTILDAVGNPASGSFANLDQRAQSGLSTIAGEFGEALRLTPHGGRAGRKSGTSQHGHGLAGDVDIARMPDWKKSQLVALAVKYGHGIGGYGPNTGGYNTLHIDFRGRPGKGPGGRALWWRHVSGRDDSWTSAPQWFREGVRAGLEGATPVSAMAAAEGGFPSPTPAAGPGGPGVLPAAGSGGLAGFATDVAKRFGIDVPGDFSDHPLVVSVERAIKENDIHIDWSNVNGEIINDLIQVVTAPNPKVMRDELKRFRKGMFYKAINSEAWRTGAANERMEDQSPAESNLAGKSSRLDWEERLTDKRRTALERKEEKFWNDVEKGTEAILRNMRLEERGRRFNAAQGVDEWVWWRLHPLREKIEEQLLPEGTKSDREYRPQPVMPGGQPPELVPRERIWTNAQIREYWRKRYRDNERKRRERAKGDKSS